MNARVYVLLDILEDKSNYALQTLQKFKEVVVVDIMEGHPNIMVIVEAPNRQKLVETIMPVLDSVDNITTDVHLLMNRQDTLVPRFGPAIICQKQSAN